MTYKPELQTCDRTINLSEKYIGEKTLVEMVLWKFMIFIELRGQISPNLQPVADKIQYTPTIPVVKQRLYLNHAQQHG